MLIPWRVIYIVRYMETYLCARNQEGQKRLKKLVASESVWLSTEHMLHIYTYMHDP